MGKELKPMANTKSPRKCFPPVCSRHSLGSECQIISDRDQVLDPGIFDSKLCIVSVSQVLKNLCFFYSQAQNNFLYFFFLFPILSY